MRAWLRQFGIRLNQSYWFTPAMLTLAAVALSFVTYYIDVRLGQSWTGGISWLHASKPDGARSLLSAIATGVLGVSGTVFSVTIAAVVYASGNYGPRLLTNFMTDRGNKWSLGVFIATFVYCLLVLRTIRSPDEAGGGATGFVPELSLLTAMTMTLLAVGVLVFFLHHVPDSIRINNVVGAIGRRALKEIETRYPERCERSNVPRPPAPRGWCISAKRVGYVQVIDFDTLRRVAVRSGRSVRLAGRSGDFVNQTSPLLYVSGEEDEALAETLRDAFAFGDDRTPEQDIEYSLDELVEIALRALSPGINDPFTAITCLHWVAAATASLAARDLGNDPDAKPYGEDQVFALADDFDHFVDRGFGSIRTSAAANDIASVIFVEALETAASDCRAPDRRAALHRQARLLLQQAQHALVGPALDQLRARVDEYIGAAA